MDCSVLFAVAERFTIGLSSRIGKSGQMRKRSPTKVARPVDMAKGKAHEQILYWCWFEKYPSAHPGNYDIVG